MLQKNCEEIRTLCAALADGAKAVRIMEVCGTHTMAIARNGLKSLLPETLELISGPGCPVCVTDQSYMDQAIALARMPGVVIATYGDMVRVPGRDGSLAGARAAGATVEVVYSADQAVELARRTPDREVVFLSVGFETTAPCSALAALKARNEGIGNFSMLTAHKMILPAMRALLAGGDVRVDGFLCPGHVSVIIGWRAYGEIAAEFHTPCVVAGFDPGQVIAGIAGICCQLADDAPSATSVYPCVSPDGNARAKAVIEEVFTSADVAWRALGVIPHSGMVLREQFIQFDAAKRFDLPEYDSYELPGCRCGDVICGRARPSDCGLFAAKCTPRDPVGPCMVSSEGACAAAYKYERHEVRGGPTHG